MFLSARGTFSRLDDLLAHTHKNLNKVRILRLNLRRLKSYQVSFLTKMVWYDKLWFKKIEYKHVEFKQYKWPMDHWENKKWNSKKTEQMKMET